jgi:hypothetical protein
MNQAIISGADVNEVDRQHRMTPLLRASSEETLMRSGTQKTILD